MSRQTRYIFPFTAIVGQEKMKKALLLNAINPRIGGVLIRGQKGTGKSTAVRALADLLPEIKVVDGCPFNCNPDDPKEMCDSCYERYLRGEQLPFKIRKVRIVTLPLNATVDRVVGTLDVERVLKEGIKAFQPGLLAEANRGILYIDEVNLLDDYLVDVLLDVAASGINTVEREGVSITHPSRFILIGTMNPEEGELRPQLLDRFGLQVNVEPITEPELQVEIVKRVEYFEEDPEGFIRMFEKKQEELKQRIIKAKKLLPRVNISDELLYKIANVCAKYSVSNRAIIVMTRTSKTLAAFYGRTTVTKQDIIEAAELALAHRLRKMPFEKPNIDRREIENAMDEYENNSEDSQLDVNLKKDNEKVFNIDKNIKFKLNLNEIKKKYIYGNGRRFRTKSNYPRGSYIDYRIPNGKPMNIALDATIKAAALRMLNTGMTNGRICIKSEDLREKIYCYKAPSLIILCIDSSGSMSAYRAMSIAKGLVYSILQDAYKNRDRISLISFRGKSAEIILEPTNKVELALEKLEELPTGGKTPLPSALQKAVEIVNKEKRRNKNLNPILVLITDGKANVSLTGNLKKDIINLGEKLSQTMSRVIILDISKRKYSPTYLKYLSNITNASYIKITKDL